MRLQLKKYQVEAIDVLARYCAGIRREMARENPRPERSAYETITERNYYTTPGFEGVPYACDPSLAEDEFAAMIEEQAYAPSRLEPETHIFQKRAFDLIGLQNKEERPCAIEIDKAV